MIAEDLSKKQALDADPKAIQEANFIGNIETNLSMFFIIEEAKETVLGFYKALGKLCNFLCFNIKMAQYNSWNVKLSHSELNKLKPGIENRTEVTLNLSSNVIGNSNDETNIAHRLLLTNTQVSMLCKAFANNSSANINLSKTA